MSDSPDFLYQAYSVSMFVLLAMYFFAQMSAINPNDHLGEDKNILGGA